MIASRLHSSKDTTRPFLRYRLVKPIARERSSSMM